MNVFWRINELNQANGKAQALLMAHIHLSQALGKGLGSLFFFDHEPLGVANNTNLTNL